MASTGDVRHCSANCRHSLSSKSLDFAVAYYDMFYCDCSDHDLCPTI